MVRALGATDPAVRAAARRWLSAQGKEVLAALENGLESDDTEVRAGVIALLRRFGRLRGGQLHFRGIEKIRGTDPAARRNEVLRVALRDGVGILEEVFDGALPDLRLESPRDLVVEAGRPTRVVARVRNQGHFPGWSGTPSGGSFPCRRVEGFGRPVEFPFQQPQKNRAIGLGGGTGGRSWYVNTANRFEWVSSGRLRSKPYRVPVFLDSQDVGRMRGRLKARVSKRHVDLYLRGRISRTKIPVACPATVASAEFEFFSVPGMAHRGAPRDKTSLSAVRQGNEVVLRLSCADGQSLAPRDFSSTWVLVITGRRRIVYYGPVDGGDRKPRRYRAAELERLPTRASPLVARFPLPRQRRVAVVYGTRFTRGTRQGQVVFSNRLLLLNDAEPPVSSGKS